MNDNRFLPRALAPVILMALAVALLLGACKKKEKEDHGGLLLLWLLGQSQSTTPSLVTIPPGVAQ